jgi:hypothetical protein
VLLLAAKTSRCQPPKPPTQRALADPPRALAPYPAMWSRITRFEILFVAAGSLLAVSVAYFF